MSLDAGEGREWSLYWTALDRPVPCRLVPVLAGWADLDERESAAGIEPGHPILIDPEFRTARPSQPTRTARSPSAATAER